MRSFFLQQGLYAQFELNCANFCLFTQSDWKKNHKARGGSDNAEKELYEGSDEEEELDEDMFDEEEDDDVDILAMYHEELRGGIADSQVAKTLVVEAMLAEQ